LSTYILSRFLDDQFDQQRKTQRWEAVDRKAAPTAAGGEAERDKRPFDLGEEYERTMAQLDLSTFDNIRVPRPEQIVERTKQRAAASKQESTELQ